ncbi:MAG: hypothetical protein F6K09_40175, partial [Merismopedia sp. SIO2A8]|nr:hypothetical protein [Merismopedia sp. SIO2A8]
LNAVARIDVTIDGVVLVGTQQLDVEESAQGVLDSAAEAAQLAQTRQGIAQTLEHWQFARVTWLVAIDRLKQVPAQTLAAIEAQRLNTFYQSSLEEVNMRIHQEQDVTSAFKNASQKAQLALASEQRSDWQQAIADWQEAIRHVEQIDMSSSYSLEVEELKKQYKSAIANAQEKLNTHAQIEGALKQSCIGELQFCRIISIDQSIKLELHESYMDAINTARGNSNYNLQAVITDHQLIVRHNLDRISDRFGIPIEVYNPDGGLLERHIPKQH